MLTLHDLPYQPTSFVGRARELDEIAALLADPACRLLTLVGPGGIGKTRLAVEAAARLSGFAGGVYFVPLQPVNSTQNLISALAAALNLQLHTQSAPDQQVFDFLRDRNLLLLLDNFEHLLDGAELLAGMLQAAPAVRLLVTSRETLNLREEWVRSVGGLDYPEMEPTDALASYSAVQLFAERVRQVRGDFSPAAEQNAVLRICRLVEGMPLALELAAARAKILPCAVIADEIQHNLDFLSAGLRNLPERHRSVQAVFDWSWRLLSEAEQRAFSQLSVFRGGFTAEAAQAVTGALPVMLSALVEKSLLRVDSTGRYQFHDLLHRFASGKLDQTPELRDQTLDAHCDYFAAFLSAREPNLTGPQLKQSIVEIETDIANVRAAWDWADAHLRIDALEQSMKTLSAFYTIRAWDREAHIAFQHAADALRSENQETHHLSLLGHLLMNSAFFGRSMPSLEGVIEDISESLAIFRRIGDLKSTVYALQELAQVYRSHGNFLQAEQATRESLTLALQVGDEDVIADSRLIRAFNVAALGSYGEARHLIGQALSVYRQRGNQRSIGNALMNLGDNALLLGDYEQAKSWLDEAVAVHSVLGHREGTAHALENRGQLAHARGDYEAAERDFQSALGIARELSLLRRIGFCLYHSGHLACGMGDYETARARFQECLALTEGQGELWKQARAIAGLGRAAFGLGDLAGAEQHLRDSLSRSRRLGFRLGDVEALNLLGRVALAKGDDAEARADFAEALKIGLDIDARPTFLASLAGVAEWMSGQGETADALELCDLCLQHPALHADTKTQVVRLRDWLVSEGTPSREALRRPVIGLDLNVVAADVIARLTSEPPSPRDADALTEREREVLRLLIARRTNQEIAEALVISVGTVKTHVHRICNKLQVSSRRDVAARAAALRLI